MQVSRTIAFFNRTDACAVVPVFVADQIGQAIVSAAEINTCMQPTPFAILLQSDHIDPVTKLPVYN
jgi:hypothetical protein